MVIRYLDNCIRRTSSFVMYHSVVGDCKISQEVGKIDTTVHRHNLTRNIDNSGDWDHEEALAAWMNSNASFGLSTGFTGFCFSTNFPPFSKIK